MADLQCPKCQAPLRSYERSGVTIDRCTECGGIFLDRGELERLIEAEGAYHEARTVPLGERTYGDDRDRERWRHDEDDEERHYGRRRRGGFLGDLFGGD